MRNLQRMVILFLAAGGMLVPPSMASAHFLRGRAARCRPCCATPLELPVGGEGNSFTSNLVTITGRLFYSDCVTPVGSVTGFNDTVRIEVWGTTTTQDDTRVTCTGPLTNLTSNYSFTIDPSQLPINKRYVTLKYFMNGNTGMPDRMVQGVNTMGRPQLIDIGIPLQRGTAGTTPTSVKLQGTFTLSDGTSPLNPSADKVSFLVTDTSMPAVTLYNNPNNSVTSYQGIQIFSSNIAATDKTLILTFNRNGQVWTANGIVGGSSRIAAQTLDITFK